MPAPFAARPTVVPRRVILAAAFTLALVVSLAPRPAAVAQGPKADSDGVASTVVKATAKDGTTVTDETDPTTGQHTITVRKGDRTVTISGVPGDQEINRDLKSAAEFVGFEPRIAAVVLGIVAVVFLAPVLAIALILAYRMRKVRLQNETMIKLAEKGIVPPAEAIAAVAAGRPPEQFATDTGSSAGGPPVLPAIPPLPVEHVKYMSKRTVWSDLRKGVLVGAPGLGLTLVSLAEDHTPSGVGLVLLFVGIGYVVLWWLEDRKLSPRGAAPGTPPGSGSGDAS